MAFYVRRFESLAVEVSLLESRIKGGALSPDDATSAITSVRQNVTGANAVGDLDSLAGRLEALAPLVSKQRAARKAERARQTEEAKAAKERLVAEAGKLAGGNDWRGGVNRFRSLLEEWKALPRLDRAADDALWHRFSAARTTYTRRRKAQFAEQAERQDAAKVIKEKIIAEAEAVAGSADWGPTTGVFRDLMQRWQAAGPAPRNSEDALWKKFRRIQDTFFEAKQTAIGEQDAEFKGNQQAKEALLIEGEALLPVTDLAAAKAGYRSLLDRWGEIGKVPRDAIKPVDQRLRAIENAIRDAEEQQWQRTNPEARARAEETAAKLQGQIDELAAKAARARARGDDPAVRQAEDAAATYHSWLAQAQKAADDFSG